MLAKIKDYMYHPVYGKLTVGMVVAAVVAYLLYKRYGD